MPNTLGYARLGIVVGKKTAKRAVDRNYMKRTLRELFRKEQVTIGAVDLLLRPLKSYSHREYVNIQAEFNMLLDKLRRRSGS